MLTIGEFSQICRVSTKTLRYYAEIGLILPANVDPENGYRYYTIEQLETMLFINRLKSYNFSLEQIKEILTIKEPREERLYQSLENKRQELLKKQQDIEMIIEQLHTDMNHLKQGKSIMSYMDDIDIQLVELPAMNLLSSRKMVAKDDYEREYQTFYTLIKRIADEHLTIASPPMVLFHEAEFGPLGLDSEFAVAIKEKTPQTRTFHPKLCLKTVVHGSYSQLPSIYAKHITWAKERQYESSDALFEIYAVDPSQAVSEKEYITEVYYPVRKQKTLADARKDYKYGK